MSAQFVRKAKPETLAAAKAVSSILSRAFSNGTFSPMARDPEIKTIHDRLAKENYSGDKPTVVFFTAERARQEIVSRAKSKVKKTPKPTQQAALSRKVYESVFDVINARQASIYTMFANLVKVDISDITKEDDPHLNRETGPIMVFFNCDGTVSSLLQGRMINSGNYCREINKALGNPTVAKKQLANVNSKLIELEQLVKKEYLMNSDLKDNQAKATKKSRQKKSKSSRGGTSRGLSTAEKRVKNLQEEVQEIQTQIASVKDNVRELTAGLKEKEKEKSTDY